MKTNLTGHLPSSRVTRREGVFKRSGMQLGRRGAGAGQFRMRLAAPLRRPNALLLLFPFFLLALGLGAQDKKPPLIMFAEGTVSYNEPGGKRTPIFTGMYLPAPRGTVLLGESSRVEIIYLDKFVELREAGVTNLEKIFGTTPQRKSFIQRFSNFVRRGLDQSSSAGSIEKAYQANQSNAQGNIRGFGDRGLLDVFPFGGRISPTEITFSWPEREGSSFYVFRLLDSLGEITVLEVKTSQPSLTLNMDELLLEDGQTYYWEAGPGPRSSDASRARLLGRGRAAPKPDRYKFTYSTRDPAEVLTEIQEDEFYQRRSRPAQQLLIEAMLLEEAGFLAAAYDTYQRGLKVSPEEVMLRRNYAAFLARWNLRTEAKRIIEESDPRRQD
jgi:hypothetical protein